MKKILVSLCAGLALMKAGAEELQWLTDVPKAVEKAKSENKLVMLDFTGSDWCGWCIKLHKEVFSQPEFADYAKKNLVLVEVDFPRRKDQSAELKKANQALQEKYKIEGYPTLILLNKDGKQVGQMGYMPGGPKPFVTELDKVKKQA
jgi:protein disulfide-isomerase